MDDLAPTDRALCALLRRLAAIDYRFVTPTPASHARVIARPERRRAIDLEGALGWSLPFDRGAIDPEVVALLGEAGMLAEGRDGLCSLVRVSSCRGRLYLHSAYPTEADDAVFFGPDSYRFADLIAAELPDCPAGARIVDIGCGAGVGAIVAADACPQARVTMSDINPQALRFAGINALSAGVAAEIVEGDGLAGIAGPIDIALANPPYIIDDANRAYRDGGGMHGGRVSLDMAAAAAERLSPGGKLILYTGSAIVRGEDRLRAALEEMAAQAGCALNYREIDPDVFGEELEKPQYAAVDRIALVAAIVGKT